MGQLLEGKRKNVAAVENFKTSIKNNLLQLLKANDGEQKSVNCVQVLSRAKDTVLGLQAQHMEMEQTRKALMLKRAKLFEEFVGKLNVFPGMANSDIIFIILKYFFSVKTLKIAWS